jgi:glycine cleavage system H protein
MSICPVDLNLRSPQLSSPVDLKYTASHEWVRSNADGTVTVGITAHAQDALGELVYVELPQAGRTLAQGEACAVVESTKAASDVYAPLAGEVLAINDTLAGEPQAVNAQPYTGGWLFTLRPADPNAVAALLNATDYDNGPGA